MSLASCRQPDFGAPGKCHDVLIPAATEFRSGRGRICIMRLIK
jgi:hypothetical protein